MNKTNRQIKTKIYIGIKLHLAKIFIPIEAEHIIIIANINIPIDFNIFIIFILF